MIPDYVDKSHEILWKPFCNWCVNNGIGYHPNDREPWWNCFIAGATTMYLLIKNKDIEV